MQKGVNGSIAIQAPIDILESYYQEKLNIVGTTIITEETFLFRKNCECDNIAQLRDIKRQIEVLKIKHDLYTKLDFQSF